MVDAVMGVRLRSVAGVTEHAIEVTRSAHWLAGTLRAAGFPTVQVWPVDGTPAVYSFSARPRHGHRVLRSSP